MFILLSKIESFCFTQMIHYCRTEKKKWTNWKTRFCTFLILKIFDEILTILAKNKLNVSGKSRKWNVGNGKQNTQGPENSS